MKDNDTITRAWKAVLCVWVRERDERNAREKDEKEEKDRKYAEELARLEQRSNELREKGLSRLSKDEHFLNIKLGIFSRFRVGYLNEYSLDEWLKLVEVLRGTKIIEELQVLVNLKNLIRKEPDYDDFIMFEEEVRSSNTYILSDTEIITMLKEHFGTWLQIKKSKKKNKSNQIKCNMKKRKNARESEEEEEEEEDGYDSIDFESED
ncbi:hypothetical protein AgCh_017776 [Apium graveolens]